VVNFEYEPQQNKQISGKLVEIPMQMATEHPFKVFPGTINDPSVFPWPPGWHREIWCLEIVRQVTTNMVKILHESILAGIPTNQK